MALTETEDIFLTSFGQVVHEAQILTGRAQQNYWTLKAVDAIKSSDDALTFELLMVYRKYG